MIKYQQDQDNRSNSQQKNEVEDRPQIKNNWKLKQAYKQHRKQLQKRLFGDHYNFSRVGLNKQKKYLLQEQKNTEIERQNMILLQKLQKIVKKPILSSTKRKVNTQALEEDSQQKHKRDHSPIDNRDYQSSSKNSNKQTKKFYISSDYKSARNSKRILFSGQKECQGKSYEIKSYIQQNKCNISIKMDSGIQTIKIDIQAYQSLYRTKLSKDHSRIIDILTFDGKIFRLAQLNDQEIQIDEDKDRKLPAINRKIIISQKSFKNKLN